MPITIEDLRRDFPCQLLCGGNLADRTISGGYACDLLSWVMSRVKTQDVWFTILNSVNVLAVAALTECACVMLTESVDMDENVLARAREKSLTILSTPLPTYEAAIALEQLLQKPRP